MSDTSSIADAVTNLLGDLGATLVSAFEQLGWAEDEITRACARHPAHADALFHAFPLLQPTADVMTTEFVYRAHCQELLNRVVAGADTRPPTNAELAAACCSMSAVAPLTPAGVTVYMRAWIAAFPHRRDVFGHVDPYEHVAGTQADSLDGDLRRKLTVADRLLRDVSCSGRHHLEPAPTCRYYTPEQLSLPVASA